MRIMVIMTAICCWSFWVLCFLHQLNPLIGPQLTATTMMWMNHTWAVSETATNGTFTGTNTTSQMIEELRNH